MSWKSIAGNQTISRANLQDAIDNGVFVIKNGVPATEPDRQITKANAQDYIYTWDLYPSFLSKASNQLPVKTNLAVQSNQIYGGTDTRIYVGNTNRNWVYSIDFAGGDSIGSVASSTDNRCILYGKSYDPGAGGGGAHVSNDYGESFTRLDSVMTTNDACLGTAMNSYGDYMILTRQVGSFDGDRANIYWSFNSGVTWTIGYSAAGVRYNYNGAAMSGNGVYATVLGSDGTDYYVFRSVSFGSSFTRTFLCKGPKVVQGGCVAMSKSGQYQLLTPPEALSPDRGKCFISNDWGITWTYFYLTVPPVIAYDVFLGCSVSAGGDYMTIVGQSSVSGDTRTFISNDFGITWTIVSGGNIAQAVDSSGQFQYQSGRASIDYGNTWFSTGFFGKSISVNPTTFTTPYIYGTTSGGTLYKSINQGSSFSLISISGYFTKVATSGGSNNGKYVAAIRDNDPGGFPNYSLYKSIDYGETWSTNFGSNGEIMGCCAVSDDGIYWLVATYNPVNGNAYVYRSYTSGVSWDYVYQYFGRPVSCAISGAGQYATIVFYTASGNFSDILRSSNYSLNWTQASSGLKGQLQNKEVTDVCISNNGRYRMLTTREGTVGNLAGRLFYSSDYGATFGEQYFDTDYGMDFCAMDNSGKVCMAGGYGLGTIKVYYSIDGTFTTTWQPPLPLYPNVGLGGLNISSDGTYWTIAANFGVGGTNTFCYTYTSTNAGSTWTQNSLSPTVNDFKTFSK
jgi:hypothetical protein